MACNGTLDAYALHSAEEVFRARLAHLGSGFSASPVAADGRLYIAGDGGEIVVVSAGPAPTHIATNTKGEPLMATPRAGGRREVRAFLEEPLRHRA